MDPEFRVTGVVRDREGRPLPNLLVRGYDAGFEYGDVFVDATTDDEGRFEIAYAGSDFDELFERRPAILFKILDPSGERVLHVAPQPIVWEAGSRPYLEIEVPPHKLPPRKEYGVTLLDSQGHARQEFEVGESLVVRLAGVAHGRSHLFRVLEGPNREVFNASLVADRFGVIEPTVLWPEIGIGQSKDGGRYAHETLEEAAAALSGRTFSVEVWDGNRVVRRRTRFRIGDKLSRPRLFSASVNGAPRRGLLLGEDELLIRGVNLSAGPLVDLYLVARQYDWRPGDPIIPIRNADGSEVAVRVELPHQAASFTTRLWPRDQMRPGSYDVIMRRVGPPEFGRDERVLRETDLVSDRLLTTVVIRDDVFRYKPIRLGCPLMQREIAGRRLPGSPYFEFTNNFPKGTDVWAALDPAGLMPSAIGKKIRYYVVAHKTPAQWSADNSLVDVTGTISEVILVSWCINGNEALVWPNPQQPGAYDLVVDFGNNAPDPANFVPDGRFDPPLDIIDGYSVVGFYVTDDPSVAGSYSVGQTSFNDPAVTIPATGVWAPWGTAGDTPSGTLSLPLVADVRYPADVNGVNVPVSALQATYPVVLIMHGMHTTADPSYLGYNYLLDHLASHGFVALSIDCNAINAINGMQDTRGHAILEHLALLQSKNSNPGLFQGKLDMTRIGIMGHSRGGDGVVQAEIFNQSLGLGWNIGAIVALAPTDFSGISPAPLALTTSKFLCVYGSNDGDVWGGSPPSTDYAGTGFRFYDRATVEKAMVFIYGATHNRFNTQWGTETRVDATSPKVLSAPDHQTLLSGYMTAFLQALLQGRQEQLDYFNGELKIPQVSSAEVHTQYRPPPPRRTLDDFESPATINLNSLGGAVTSANLNGPPQKGPLGSLDAFSPHQTKGLKLAWNLSTATYQSQIPLGQRDLSGFGFLSFRVSQTVGSTANLMNQLQDLDVRLTTAGGGNSRGIRAGFYGSIPFPYQPAYSGPWVGSEGPNTKAALTTVQIPLSAWTIKALSAPIVDLTNVESVTFELRDRPTGELEFDDILFTH